MKIGILGDCHFSNKTPRRRKDDYFQTQLNKLNESLDIFQTNKCDCIIQAGDFFDTSTVGNFVISEIIKVLKTCTIPFYGIWGNHDVAGHTEFTYYRSPLAVLESAGVIKLLGDKPTILENSTGTIDIYGASFGKDVPYIYDDIADTVLVIHRMIGDKPLYDGQELETPNEFVSKYEYGLTICGDYHYDFVNKIGDKFIINAGCLVRKTIGKRDLEHKPKVIIFDTKTKQYEIFLLRSALPVEQIFDLSVDTDETNLEIEGFVNSLFENSENVIDWKRELFTTLEDRKVSSGVVREIESSLKGLEI